MAGVAHTINGADIAFEPFATRVHAEASCPTTTANPSAQAFARAVSLVPLTNIKTGATEVVMTFMTSTCQSTAVGTANHQWGSSCPVLNPAYYDFVWKED